MRTPANSCAHLVAPPPDVRDIRPDVAAPLAEIVGKLLAKDPDDRYQHASGLIDDLDRVAAGQRDGFPLGSTDTRAGESIPLIGRGPELEQLRAAWRAAAAGPGRTVLIEGPPGVGKSRLARALTAPVRESGRPVLFGACQADTVPLAPLRQAVDGYLHGVALLPEPARQAAGQRLRAAAGDTANLLAPLSAHLAELLQIPADADAGDDQHGFGAAVVTLLTGLARAEGGMVLHLDDVHWCDDATARVLRQLATQLAESSLLVLMTARDGDAGQVPDELQQVSPVRLALAPLAEGTVAELVSYQLGALVVPPELVTRLTARSAGNPLAVLEYTRAVVDAGLLRPCWGRWLLDEAGLDALALPDDIMDLIVRRIDGLGATAVPC
jgi:predicted ATPase